MTPDDVTQPFTQRPTPPPGPPPGWPRHDAPTMPPRGAPPRRRIGWLWGALGFILGVILTAVIALATLAPAPAPSASAQTNSAELTVTLTDALLTQAISSSLQTNGASLAQARAHIQANNEVVVSGQLQGSSDAGSAVTIVAQPYVSQHTLAIKVLRVSFGGVALPTALLDAMRDQINASLARSSQISLGVGKSLVISGVSCQNGSMTLTYAPAG